MDLYICEKRLQAEDLAEAMGKHSLHTGYFQLDNCRVTWCQGHLLELYRPDDYSKEWRQWNLDSLPIIPGKWKKKVRKSATRQYEVVRELIGKAHTVFIASDYDREGEALVREVLSRTSFKGSIKRVCLTALDPASIKKALDQIRDGSETQTLADAANARSRADWLIGMNLTRIYTILARQLGVQDVYHIGRVLSPTIALVCRRDREIANHTPEPYCQLSATVLSKDGAGSFSANWICPEEFADEKKRCTDKAAAVEAQSVTQEKNGIITAYERKHRKQKAPLPFDLGALQRLANSRWNYTAAETLSTLQALYEKKKLITYPRTQCRYLPSSFINDTPHILKALADSDQLASRMVEQIPKQGIMGARVYNDEKNEAHHAIIPTAVSVSFSELTTAEQRLYDVIRRYFIAQFYPAYEFYESKVVVTCERNNFKARGSQTIRFGWKRLLNKKDILIEQDDDSPENNPKPGALPPLSHGENVSIVHSEITDHVTNPPSHFTEASLISAMTNISRFVEEEEYKKVLDDRSGIGTPATRSEVIDGAVKRGYIVRDGKKIRATEKAFNLTDVLPAPLKSAAITAMWEQELELVESGVISMNDFVAKVQEWTENMVLQIKQGFVKQPHDS